MRVLRVELDAWTASFRNPLFVSGFQPTLPIPPLSTIYGLLSAARGDYVLPSQAKVGFIFRSVAKGVDLEVNLKTKYICKREFLIDAKLFLYTPDLWLGEFFDRPHYPLLLGRSTELATVSKIEEIELIETDRVVYCDTLLPFPMAGIYGQLQALPTHFTSDRPRRPQGIGPFYLLTEKIGFSGRSWVDAENDWGVYIHG